MTTPGAGEFPHLPLPLTFSSSHLEVDEHPTPFSTLNAGGVLTSAPRRSSKRRIGQSAVFYFAVCIRVVRCAAVSLFIFFIFAVFPWLYARVVGYLVLGTPVLWGTCFRFLWSCRGCRWAMLWPLLSVGHVVAFEVLGLAMLWLSAYCWPCCGPCIFGRKGDK